jgi:miniconductance mechanosensitive channel
MDKQIDAIEKFIAGLNGSYLEVFAYILGFSVASYFIFKLIIVKIIGLYLSRHRKGWEDIFKRHKTFNVIPTLIPLIILFLGSENLRNVPKIIENTLQAIITWVITLGVIRIIRTLHAFYKRNPATSRNSITGYIQFINILIFLVGTIIAICVFLDKSPLVFLSGLGALTAVLGLIFKETLMSFMAGIQITMNHLIQKQDWIEAPAFGADGDVVDITLHVVKIKNWDNTISVIPTYKLLESGFKNWQEIYRTEGRRITRAIIIDQSTIKLMDKKDLIAIEKDKFLADLLKGNLSKAAEKEPLTNLTALRKYLAAYLHDKKIIRDDMTFMIRLLEPTDAGLPLEMYVFSKETDWEKYEEIQSKITEYALAVLPKFGLRAYQRRSDK